MNWVVKIRPDGLPSWKGIDSVYDLNWRNRWEWWLASFLLLPLAFFATYGAVLAVASVIMHALPNGALDMFDDDNLAVFIPFVALVVGSSAYATWRTRRALKERCPRPGKFYERVWRLEATPGNLCYNAEDFTPYLDPRGVSRQGHFWLVTLDQIARVESGPTVEWQRMREYEGRPSFMDQFQPIPPAEYQTFLFLNDGSRRVILTANADRESCGTLAMSIRAWLVEQRNRTGVPVGTAAGFGL
ncbi:MAG TPA: hypothetical protein VEX16_03700 [Methyloceanibacter sp.]|nr:hypothetical protein [Methyloceanibacter sp.]